MCAKNRKITIQVEAEKLYMSPPADPWVDKFTALTDDEGFSSPFGDANARFETGVYMDYTVTWVIEVAFQDGEDKGYDVRLNSIYHEPTKGNPNFFNSEELYPVKNPKEIVGTISKDPGLENKSDTYTIYFAISDSKGNWQNYPLDPRLKMKVRSK